jgi:hypothetical protein
MTERDEESDYARFYNNQTLERRNPFPASNICTVTFRVWDVMHRRTDSNIEADFTRESPLQRDCHCFFSIITKADGILVFQPIKPSLSNADSGTPFITLLSLPAWISVLANLQSSFRFCHWRVVAARGKQYSDPKKDQMAAPAGLSCDEDILFWRQDAAVRAKVEHRVVYSSSIRHITPPHPLRLQEALLMAQEPFTLVLMIHSHWSFFHYSQISSCILHPLQKIEKNVIPGLIGKPVVSIHLFSSLNTSEAKPDCSQK